MTGNEANYEVVVVGGGAAGLSGALTLARARRSVAVVDGGAPRNAPAEGVHGFLGHDGVPPAGLLRRGRDEVRGYGGRLLEDEVATVSPDDGGGFGVHLAGGGVLRARRLLVATGLVDELPAIPGVREQWGSGVMHCPYCHGWEVRDRALGVLATGPMSVHQALLLRQWSDDVAFFTHTRPALEADEAERLEARGIRVVPGPVEALVAEAGTLAGVRLRDGTMVARESVAVAPRMLARAGFLAGLGLEPREHASGMGTFVAVDGSGRTDVPGVWAAGNVTDPSAQVVTSAAAGTFAAAQINADLVEEETARAVGRMRAGRGAEVAG